MHIRELTEKEFIDFQEQYQFKSLYQTPEYAYTMQNQGFEFLMLGLVDENKILGASIILIEKTLGFKYAYAPRGFMLDYNNNDILETFTDEIKKFLGKRDIMAIKINPIIIRTTYDYKLDATYFDKDYDMTYYNLERLGYYHLGYNSQFESLKPRFESIIDLSIGYQDIFNNFKRPLKAKLRVSETNGIKIFRSNDENLEYLYIQTKNKYPRDLKYFKDMYHYFKNRNMIDYFYAKLDLSEHLNATKTLYEQYEEMSNQINLELQSNIKNKTKLVNRKIEIDKSLHKYKRDLIEATKLLNKHPNGIVLASALIIKDKDTAHLIMDGYDKEFKNLNAKHLLIWRLIENYSKKGFKSFNLGGMTDLKDDSKYSGLNKFKLGFNPKVYEYLGDLELITNPTLYFMYRHAKPLTSVLKK